MIGKLRHRLLLQAPLYSNNERTWQDEGYLWAAVRALSGAESTIGEGESALTNYEVIVRYRAGITPEMRFIFDGRTLAIKAVLDKQERKRYLTCLCEEGRDG